MKRYLWSLLAVLSLTGLSAQNYSDALRYSDLSPMGSARFAGTGGSLTPMGVDMTTLHTNPAGIGWNRYNMAQITPGFSFTGTDANLVMDPNSGSLSESVVNLGVSSAGAVFAGTTRSVNWSTLNFGVSLTRMANFNQQTRFGGRTQGSIIDGFVSDYNADIGDAYGNDLLLSLDGLFLDGDGLFSEFDFVENEGKTIRRNGLVDRSGGIHELALGLGGNYKEKVLWGLSFGIPFMNYNEVNTYSEIDDENQVTRFEEAGYDQNLSARGNGFNLKFGVQLLPTEQLRISAAVHTPTLWSIDETYTSTFKYNFEMDGDALGGTALSPRSEANFNLSTPWRFMLGAGYLIGTSGFVSVDADYTNFTGNSISFDDFATANELSEATNADIDAILASSIGVRLGGELNVKPFQLRAGIGYRQVPFSEFFNDEDEATLTYSAGAGYSVGKFFVDVAATYQGYSSFRNAYETNTFSGQTILTDRSRVSALLTVGIRGWNAGF